MVVVADKVVALNKAHDAVVHDVEDARFVEHLEDVLMFRAGLEPEQRHGFHSVSNREFPHGLFGSFWGEKEHHDFRHDAVLQRRTNRSAQNGSAGVPWVHGNQAPTLAVEVVNGPVRWLFGV